MLSSVGGVLYVAPPCDLALSALISVCCVPCCLFGVLLCPPPVSIKSMVQQRTQQSNGKVPKYSAKQWQELLWSITLLSLLSFEPLLLSQPLSQPQSQPHYYHCRSHCRSHIATVAAIVAAIVAATVAASRSHCRSHIATVGPTTCDTFLTSRAGIVWRHQKNIEKREFTGAT